jgi:hypothetical protein
MATIVHKHAAQGRAGQSVSHALLISGILLAILSTAFLVGRQIVAPNAPSSSERYRGLVQLAPDHEGRCALFELDNRTGYMWPKGETPCGDITTTLQSRGGGRSLDRLNSIAEHFRGR